jgi:hypothetical protein
MRIHTFIFALALVAAGCDSRDAKLHRQVAGSWPVAPSGSMTFFPNGSFHFTNSFVVSNATLAFSSDGTWDVRDGFLITDVTNSIASGTNEKPPVGMTHRSKIYFIDEHNLSYGDGAYHR